jgi:hypothetical protein
VDAELAGTQHEDEYVVPSVAGPAVLIPIPPTNRVYRSDLFARTPMY